MWPKDICSAGSITIAIAKPFDRLLASHGVTLDRAIRAGAQPADGPELRGVLALCAILHGEWVRIQPFANGNGRTARLWANWAVLRYGLPPFVTVKPRSGEPYGLAAMASMSRNHAAVVAAFDQMLRTHLRLQ